MAAVALEGLDWMEGQTDVESKGQELGGTELFEILREKKNVLNTPSAGRK